MAYDLLAKKQIDNLQKTSDQILWRLSETEDMLQEARQALRSMKVFGVIYLGAVSAAFALKGHLF